MSFEARFDEPNYNDLEVDLSTCTTCGFDCDVHGYCKQDAYNDCDLQDKYLNDVLTDKGYGGCNLKAEKIRGKTWLVLYPLYGGYTIAEKLNIELGCPVVPLKTRYTSGLCGLNVSNCYGMLLQVIDQLSDMKEKIDYSKVINVDDMYTYVTTNYPESFQHCLDLNITAKTEVINLIEAINDMNLQIVTNDGEIMGYIAPEGVMIE